MRNDGGGTKQLPSYAQLIGLLGWTKYNCSLLLMEWMPELMGPYSHLFLFYLGLVKTYFCTFMCPSSNDRKVLGFKNNFWCNFMDQGSDKTKQNKVILT